LDLFDPMATERVEAELDSFIEKRALEAREANSTEVAYAESVRRFHQARRQWNAKAWHDYHDDQLRRHDATYMALRARHLAERNRYARLLGTADTNNPKEAA
jgi:hypothetical protein